MKRTLYSLLLLGTFSVSLAQGNGPLFKPSKITSFYPSQGATAWELSFSMSFTYNQNGDVLTVIHHDADGVPTQKDSLVYSPKFVMLENHRLVWDAAKSQFVPYEKVISTYDPQDRLISSLVFKWTGVWELETGTENVRTYDPATREETEVTTSYDQTTGKWNNPIKLVTAFDEHDQKTTVTLSVADNEHNFLPFSRQKFTGWHNYSKQIETGQTKELYENGAWVQESTSTTVKNGSLYHTNEVRFTGPTAGTYRTFFSEDNTYREFFKQHGGGWLGLSVFTKNDTLEQVVYNTFQGDLLTKIQTDEREVDAKGSFQRYMTKVQNAMGITISFSEESHSILYDNRDLPLEDITLLTKNELVDPKPTERIVYSDYVDVRLTTKLETEGAGHKEALTLYPNPGIGIFTVSENMLINTVLVHNMAGVFIKAAAMQGNILDISDLPAGLYQLQMETEKGTFRQKVVVVAQ